MHILSIDGQKIDIKCPKCGSDKNLDLKGGTITDKGITGMRVTCKSCGASDVLNLKVGRNG